LAKVTSARLAHLRALGRQGPMFWGIDWGKRRASTASPRLNYLFVGMVPYRRQSRECV
jgi:hypothetical protein